MIVGVNTAMHRSSVFCRGFGCCFFQALCSAKVKKETLPFTCAHAQCHPPLLIHTLTQAGKHTPAAEDEGQGQVGPQRDIVES